MPLCSWKEEKEGGRKLERERGKEETGRKKSLLNPSSLEHIRRHTPSCTHPTLLGTLADLYAFNMHNSHVPHTNTGLFTSKVILP